MKRLLKYFKGYRITSFMGPLFKLMEAVFELLIPLVVKRMIDNGIGKGDTDYVIRMGVLMILLGLVGFVCSLIAQLFAALSATGAAAGVRKALFDHVMKLSFADTDEVGTSTLITRMTNDINLFQSGVNMALRLLLRSPFIVFGAMIMAFTQDFKAALIFVVAIAVLFIIVIIIMCLTIPGYKTSQESLDSVLTLTRESFNGVRVIRAFGNEDGETEKFNKANARLRAIQLKVGRISAYMNPLTYTGINIAIAALIYTCGIRVDAGDMTAGETVALYNYMSQILIELIKLANLMVTISKGLASAGRMADVLDIVPGMERNEGAGRLSSNDSETAVEFDHAFISYTGEGNGALSDVNFAVKKGEVIGIIGGTGSGKSTLVSLIPRFYDVTGGSVRVFGKDVRDCNVSSLRESIGIVMQKAVLFKGTVKSNLLVSAPDADDKELAAALSAAQINLPLDRKISQGGSNLSGGQRQRVSVARALVKKPEILILDDAASALDYATEFALRQTIKNLPEHPTTFIVSQRVSSVMHADRIVVLDDGHVTGIGSHEELLRSDVTYREIYESQNRNSVSGGEVLS
ncbi:MAG: ABC transporter ATP-binding protein/permease [Lachnospiraceae bacterium]|nr:ABC transporter ATP-binding protein/permease [Lachnospiraceae bacterium]